MTRRETGQPRPGTEQPVAAPRPLGRRAFLRASGLAAVTTGLGGLAGCTQERDVAAPRSTGTTTPDLACATTFFRPHEAETVEALVGRILPGSPDDPGAREAGVVEFIDCVLATSDGIDEPTYLQPPFPAPDPEDLEPLRAAVPDLPALVTGGEPDDPTFSGPGPSAKEITDLRDSSIESTSYGVIPLPKNQFDRYGYQSLIPPAEMVRRGLVALDAHSRNRFGADFVHLGPADQDSVVTDLADDAADTFDVPSAEGFFELMRRYTIEGMFSDPMYGGNRDMAGWRLLGYPGAQRAYTAEQVRTPGYVREPQSLADMHRFNSGHAAEPEQGNPVSGSGRDRSGR